MLVSVDENRLLQISSDMLSIKNKAKLEKNYNFKTFGGKQAQL